ncbi:MAG: hypothetical protein UR12_C0025G0002 [candidate division TM6 bacterium GW2011_GWF2_30_66]|nr:MAG: hypothetical protein UR12_C0025G0002 [candidate division TM6 bacterium GW2011_GWF2_30_66]
MSKKVIFVTMVLLSFVTVFGENFVNGEKIIKKEIIAQYRKRPFYFRFPPKLKDIKSKKVIIAKIDYDHPVLGMCSYEVVKDLDRSKFFGWCNTKKIERRKTQIFELDGVNFKKLPVVSSHKVELGLNENLRAIVNKINAIYKQVLKK